MKALQSPEVKERYAALVLNPILMTHDQFAAFLMKDSQVNSDLVKAAGIQPN